MLVNDGSIGGVTFIQPAYKSSTANYAIEAEIQPISGSFGLFLRKEGESKYYIAYDCLNCGGPGITSLDASQDRYDLASGRFDDKRDWHVYRLEASGNQLRLLIDGVTSLHAIDNRYLDGREVGLAENSNGQFNVRSFKVIALD